MKKKNNPIHRSNQLNGAARHDMYPMQLDTEFLRRRSVIYLSRQLISSGGLAVVHRSKGVPSLLSFFFFET